MAKYETVADIEQERIERLERARLHDALRAEWSQNARLVERLEAQSVQKQITSLQRVIDEANKLPEDVIHDGIGFMGGCAVPNGITRPMLVAIASSALVRVQRRDEERVKTLDAAKKRRDDAKARLDEEFPE
jgi:hypothetical protein